MMKEKKDLMADKLIVSISLIASKICNATFALAFAASEKVKVSISLIASKICNSYTSIKIAKNSRSYHRCKKVTNPFSVNNFKTFQKHLQTYPF